MRHMRHPDVTYLIVRPKLIDHSSKWDAIDELKARDSSRRVIVLPPGYDPEAFIRATRLLGDLSIVLGTLTPDYPPVVITWCDGYDLYIAGRKAGGAHTAEVAITNAERLISGDLVPQPSWLVG